MKTRTETIKLTLPVKIEEGLDLATLHPALAEAERARDAAGRRLADARRLVLDRQAEVDRVAAAVTAGRATAEELERAIVAMRTAAALVAPAERAHAEAEAAHDRVRAEAVARLKAEERRRLESLTAEARKLLATLEEIEDIELDLGAAAAQACGETTIGLRHAGYSTRRAALAERDAAQRLIAAEREAAQQAIEAEREAAQQAIEAEREAAQQAIKAEHEAARKAEGALLDRWIR